MSKQTINIGASPNDGTGTPLRTSFDYTNQNFTELYTALGGGVGLPGATTQVIFNDGGTNLAGDAGLVYNKTTDALTVAGLVTAGSATITGDLTVDTSTLKVTASTDTVTVGATTTDSKFRVLDANYNGLRIGFLPGTSNYNLYDATVHEFRTANVTPQQLYTFQASSAVWYDGAGGTRMTLDSTGLGIGVSPTYKIDVSSSSNIVGRISSSNVFNTGFNITNTTASTWSLYSFGSNDATLQNSFGIYHQNGTSFLQITQAGNVGIGVTPSAWASAVKGLQLSTYGAIGASSGNMNVFGNLYSSASGTAYLANGFGSLLQLTGGQFVFYQAPNNTLGAGTIAALTQAMTLDASGNLLVASGVVRAAGRTQIGAGYIADIASTGNSRGIFFSSTGLFPTDGSGNSSDNTYDLGSATYRWDTVFAGNGTINTSDRNEKQDISDLSASEKRVASSIKQLVKKYRFKDAVASKGENARIHVGWIAQDIQNAFSSEGLDASKYGMFCSDTWEENGVEKTRLGLRYDEVLAFVVSAI